MTEIADIPISNEMFELNCMYLYTNNQNWTCISNKHEYEDIPVENLPNKINKNDVIFMFDEQTMFGNKAFYNKVYNITQGFTSYCRIDSLMDKIYMGRFLIKL